MREKITSYTSRPNTWRRVVQFLALVTLFTLCGSYTTQATDRTWDGGGGGGNIGVWAQKLNWGNSSFPASGDLATFSSVVGSSSTPTVSADTIGAIRYDSTAAAFTIQGASTLTINANSATLGSGIGIQLQSGSANSQTISAGVVLGASQTWDIQANTLTVSGVVSDAGAGRTLTKTGAGILTLSGASANTYSGVTTVNVGELDLNKTAAINAIAGNLVIGDGTGTDTVKLLANNQIIDTAAVTVNSSGVFNVNGRQETIASLSISGGSATIAGGRLTLTGALDMTGGGISSSTAGKLVLGGNVTGNMSASSATISGALDFGGATRTFTIADGVAANDMSISAIISNGGLTKAGAGTLELSGGNNYSGVTTINAGTLLVSANAPSGLAGALGSATSAVLLGDTTGSSDASLLTGGAYTIGRDVTVQSGSSGIATLGGNTDNNSTFSGLVTLNKAATITQVATTGGNALGFTGGFTAGSSGLKNLTFNNAGAVTVSGIGISDGSGQIGLIKQNGGTLNLNVASTYSGGTTLTGGAITLGAANALGSGAFNFNGGTLNANNQSASLGALTLSANSTLNLSAGGAAGSLTFSSVSWTAGTLTINNWAGASGHAGTDDRIYITTDPTAFLSHFSFTGFAPGATWISSTHELVPVPEPIHYALALFGFIFAGIRGGRYYLARRFADRKSE